VRYTGQLCFHFLSSEIRRRLGSLLICRRVPHKAKRVSSDQLTDNYTHQCVPCGAFIVATTSHRAAESTAPSLKHTNQQPLRCFYGPSNAKTSYSKLRPKIGCLSTYGPPSNTCMILTAHAGPQPKRHPYLFSRLCTDDLRVSLYFTMGRLFSPPPQKNCPFQWGDLEHHLIHGYPGPPKSSTQMAARSVQPFLQG